MPLSPTTEHTLHRVFTFSILIKGILASLETASGIFVLFITPTSVTSVILFISQGELSENPNDPFIQTLLHMAQTLSIGGKTFAALYLLSHGIVKLMLVVFLLKQKLWAYPASLVVLSAFIVYQLYRFTLTHSLWMILLTVLDLVIISLIHHEYQQVRRTLASRAT